MRPWSRVRLRPLEYSAPDKRPTHPSGMIGTPIVLENASSRGLRGWSRHVASNPTESPRSRADPAAAERSVSRRPAGSITWGRTGLVTILPLVITRRFRPATSIPPYRASRGDDGRATMMSRGSLIPLGRSNLRQKLPRPPHVVPVALSEPRFGCEERFFEARPFVCHRDAGNETHDENDV